MVTSIVGKIQRARERDGLFGTLRLVARNLAAIHTAFRPARTTPKTWFDEKYGTDTDAQVKVDDLGVSGPSKTFAIHYEAMVVKIWEEAMALLNINYGDFTFIDLGSGKGRALMLAAGYPFKCIIGVEFSAPLHRIATRNMEIYSGPRLCSDIRLVHCDAVAFSLPAVPLVILISNPFVGDVMRQVVSNIDKSAACSSSPVYVLYVNPINAEALDASNVLHEIGRTAHCRIFTAKGMTLTAGA